MEKGQHTDPRTDEQKKAGYIRIISKTPSDASHRMIMSTQQRTMHPGQFAIRKDDNNVSFYLVTFPKSCYQGHTFPYNNDMTFYYNVVENMVKMNNKKPNSIQGLGSPGHLYGWVLNDFPENGMLKVGLKTGNGKGFDNDIRVYMFSDEFTYEEISTMNLTNVTKPFLTKKDLAVNEDLPVKENELSLLKKEEERLESLKKKKIQLFKNLLSIDNEENECKKEITCLEKLREDKVKEEENILASVNSMIMDFKNIKENNSEEEETELYVNL